MDFAVMVLAGIFFAVSWRLVRFIERLRGGAIMSVLEDAAAVLALGCFVYLAVALLKPEWFQ